MSSIIQGHATNASLQSNQIAQNIQVNQGSYKGQNVTLSAPNQLQSILNAAEEATMQASEKAEKKLSNRKTQERGRNIPISVKKIQEYLQKLPDLEKKSSVKEFIERLLKNPSLAYEQLKRHNTKGKSSSWVFSDDPSLQFAALSIVRDTITDHNDFSNLAHELDIAINSAMHEAGPEIIAGLNISNIAQQHSNSETTASLRQTYRDSVLDYKGLTNTYRKIIEKHGEDNFEEVRIFLLSALSTDMNAKGPSIPTENLRAINDDMFFLEVLGGLHDQCALLTLKMKTYFKQNAILQGQILMSELLELKEEPWLQPINLFNLIERMHLNENLSHRLYFLTEVHKLLRLLPIKAFDDENDRITLLTTAQDALDELISLIESED